MSSTASRFLSFVAAWLAHAVHGNFSPLNALARMLDHTPPKAWQDEKTKAISIVLIDAPGSARESPPESSQSKAGEILRRPNETPSVAPPSMKKKNLIAALTGWLAVAVAPAPGARAAADDAAHSIGDPVTTISGQF